MISSKHATAKKSDFLKGCHKFFLNWVKRLLNRRLTELQKQKNQYKLAAVSATQLKFLTSHQMVEASRRPTPLRPSLPLPKHLQQLLKVPNIRTKVTFLVKK